MHRYDLLRAPPTGLLTFYGTCEISAPKYSILHQ
jgi:hypothetical protein